jgi:UDPglucose 6-dehydrogenase
LTVEMLEVGVVGAGYVGLATGACLAYLGHRVTCVDRDEERVGRLEEGRVPFFEPGLEGMVARGMRAGRLSFAGAMGLDSVVGGADVVFVAVGTPQGEDGAADLSNVADVARRIGRALAGDAALSRERPLIVVNKSTVPVGGGDYVSALIEEGAEGRDAAGFAVVSNPEFLREGSAVYDALFPDRIVVGSDEPAALRVMRSLYAPIVGQTFPTEIGQDFPTELDPRPRTAVPFVTTDLASAEMIKYAANAFLATKISFINEVSNLCELVGADVTEVAQGIGLDGRINPRFLNAGIGWGGSCLPKDVAALMAMAREYDHEPTLLEATAAVNERQRRRVIAKLQRDLHTLKGKRVALLGLSFKPETDDLREAPSLKIAEALHTLGARAVGYDPVAGEAAAKRAPELLVRFDPYEALREAHAAVVVTEWEEIKDLDPQKVALLMRDPKLVVDGRNALDPSSWRDAGLLYTAFGR